MPIRIFLISNYRLLLDGMTALIATESDRFHLAGATALIDQAPEEITKSHADITLLEIDGITPTRTLTFIEKLRTVSDTKILLLTRLKNSSTNDAAVALGANGVIGSESSSEQLYYACSKVIAGEIWLDRTATGRIINQLSRKNRDKNNYLSNDKAAMLTDRELQVITAILKSNNPGKIIANELGISESTLRNKLSVIYEKLGVHNRQGLFSYAHENGLI